jgi:phosphoglycolate phosphatase
VYHLFFDLDGTLTDPAPGITRCLAYAALRLGRSIPEAAALQRYIGPPLRESFVHILETTDAAVIEEAVGLYRERFSAVGIYENAVCPGIERALGRLVADGFGLSVVTSKPQGYADRVIEHFGLTEFFRRVYGAELSGERSSKTELVAQALLGESVEPSQACMIGDREHDIRGATANGVAALGVTWGYGTLEELHAAGASHVLDSVEKLVPVCRELRTRASRSLT